MMLLPSVLLVAISLHVGFGVKSINECFTTKIACNVDETKFPPYNTFTNQLDENACKQACLDQNDNGILLGSQLADTQFCQLAVSSPGLCKLYYQPNINTNSSKKAKPNNTPTPVPPRIRIKRQNNAFPVNSFAIPNSFDNNNANGFGNPNNNQFGNQNGGFNGNQNGFAPGNNANGFANGNNNGFGNGNPNGFGNGNNNFDASNPNNFGNSNGNGFSPGNQNGFGNNNGFNGFDNSNANGFNNNNFGNGNNNVNPNIGGNANSIGVEPKCFRLKSDCPGFADSSVKEAPASLSISKCFDNSKKNFAVLGSTMVHLSSNDFDGTLNGCQEKCLEKSTCLSINFLEKTSADQAECALHSEICKISTDSQDGNCADSKAVATVYWQRIKPCPV